MRLSRTLYMMVVLCLGYGGVTSCIKDEPLNKECDIRKAEIHLPVPEDYFDLLEDTSVYIMDSYSENTIVFQGVKSTAVLNGITPTFTISAGAELFPRQGTRRDFSDGKTQRYYVIAEDTKEKYPIPATTAEYDAYTERLEAAIKSGAHIRQYDVLFSTRTLEVADEYSYDFENYLLETKNRKFYEWSDPINGRPRTIPNWATSNMGYGTTNSSARADEYPVIPIGKGGVDGGAYVKLETMDTGAFGKQYNMPLAAGSLFLGTFDFSKVLTNTLQATRFGENSILARKPDKFTGYYKYYPGEKMTGPKGEPLDETDEPDIYCVVYKNHDSKGKSVVLTGSDVNTSDLVVGRAIITKWEIGTKDWVPFELDFVWKEEIDENVLKSKGYNFAIVCSASKKGATYSGALGSILYIDNFKLKFE